MKIIELAHKYWAEILEAGDLAIDATVGNGKDTLALAKILQGKGKIIGYDLQKEALDKAKVLLEPYQKDITLLMHSHTTFTVDAAKLIVYNLGYLPGGDKTITTRCETTLESVQNALTIVVEGGALSIMCYPGHLEGEREESAILTLSKNLDAEKWSVCHHRLINRQKAPSLILILRKMNACNYSRLNLKLPLLSEL